MLITKSFLAEGGWVYVGSALVSVVLILIFAFGMARAGTAAAALLGCTLAVGAWFTAGYARAINEPTWDGELSTRVQYERCMATGGPLCHRDHPQMAYFLEHRLLGVYAPLSCGAALGVVMLIRRRRASLPIS